MNANMGQRLRRFWMAVLTGLIALAVPVGAAHAQAAPSSGSTAATSFVPGMYGSVAPRISPADAAAQESAASQTGVSNLALSAPVQGPGSVVELPRALKHDPSLIYQYLYNNLDFIPVYVQLKA